ncbi:MAG: histidine--tRNA ligase [Syntrophomonadaceae bacterium]
MELKAPRGTYDVLPPETAKWQYVEGVLRDTARLFGYSEVRTPIFEHTELFERGVGDTTDIVTKEMYTFEDKANRSLTLRPEGTASCVRALVEHSVYGGIMPVKWYYSGPMFRYDRPQAGRYRQFCQFGVEVFGSHSPFVDAEVIMLLVEVLQRLGLDGYELHLNSVGCPKCRETHRQKLVEHMAPVQDQLCHDCQARLIKNPLRVIDCKVRACQEAIAGFPTIFDHLCEPCHEHYDQVKTVLRDNDIAFIQDHNLVRGLDYYTNTAFEIHIPQIGAQSAIGGGGRYNGLIQAIGGPDLPGIGFAVGMERLLLALETLSGAQRAGEEGRLQVFLAVQDDKYSPLAMRLLDQIRRTGIVSDRDYNQRSMKAQMKYADKLGARIVVVLGEAELARGTLVVRDMLSREQHEVPTESLTAVLKDLLA